MSYNPSSNRSGYPSSSATARVCENLAVYGHTPHDDEPEYRPVPEDQQLEGSVEAMFAAVTGPLADTALEDDVEVILWSLVNALHRTEERINRALDNNELAHRRSQDEQDMSEVKDVELQTLTRQGQELRQRRDAFTHMREHAERAFEQHTGSEWLPRSGPLVNRKAQTAAMIDSRDYLAAKKYADTNVMIPPGTRVAVVGGPNFQDHKLMYAVLDEVKARVERPGLPMVVLYGAYDKGADRITATWAKNRGVTLIAFKPDFTLGQSAPFKRNDAMLAAKPHEIVVFDGNGITHQIARNAKDARDIRVNDHRTVVPPAPAK